MWITNRSCVPVADLFLFVPGVDPEQDPLSGNLEHLGLKPDGNANRGSREVF